MSVLDAMIIGTILLLVATYYSHKAQESTKQARLKKNNRHLEELERWYDRTYGERTVTEDAVKKIEDQLPTGPKIVQTPQLPIDPDEYDEVRAGDGSLLGYIKRYVDE